LRRFFLASFAGRFCAGRFCTVRAGYVQPCNVDLQQPGQRVQVGFPKESFAFHEPGHGSFVDAGFLANAVTGKPTLASG